MIEEFLCFDILFTVYGKMTYETYFILKILACLITKILLFIILSERISWSLKYCYAH